MSSVAVVVVSYNTRSLLRDCLHSVRAAAPAEVVVVDNGSTDGSADMVRSEFAGVRLVEARDNPGYGGAANRGIARTSAPYVCLLNSDTRVAPDAFTSMARYLDDEPRVGLLGPRLSNPDGSLQRSCYPFPSPLTAFLGETRLGYLIRFVPRLRQRHPRTWRHDAARPMPWVLGAALTIRRTAFSQVGGFDEAYFMYFEEVDLCYRLWQAGWQVHFAPVTDVVHVGGASTAPWAAAMKVEYYASMARFYRHHRTGPQRRALDVIVRTTALPRLVLLGLQLLFTRDPAARRRRLEAAAGWASVVRGIRSPMRQDRLPAPRSTVEA